MLGDRMVGTAPAEQHRVVKGVLNKSAPKLNEGTGKTRNERINIKAAGNNS